MKAITLPNGERLTFPNETPDAEIINSYVNTLLGVDVGVEEEEEKEQAGFFGGLREGITSLGDVPEAVKYLADPSTASREELLAGTDPKYKYQDFYGIKGLGDAFQFGKEILGGSLGQSVAPLAAGAAAAAVSGPFAPVTGPLAFIGTAGLQYLGETAERQARLSEQAVEEGKEAIDPNVAKIVSASFGAGALDRATLALFPNVSKLFGQTGKEAAKDISEEVVDIYQKEGMGAAVARLADSPSVPLGAIRGAGIEAFQEVVQTMVSRAGAEDSLFSQDAVKEYIPAFVGGAILGAPVGALDTFSSQAAKVSEAKSELQDLLDDRGISQRKQNEKAIEGSLNNAEIDSSTTASDVASGLGIYRNVGTNEKIHGTKTDYSADATPSEPITNLDRSRLGALFDTFYDDFTARVNDLTSIRTAEDAKVNKAELDKVNELVPKLKTLARQILTNTKETKDIDKGKDKKAEKAPFEYSEKFKNAEPVLNEKTGKFQVISRGTDENLIKAEDGAPVEFDSKTKAAEAIAKQASIETKRNFKNAREVVLKELETKQKEKLAKEKEEAEAKAKEKEDAKSNTSQQNANDAQEKTEVKTKDGEEGEEGAKGVVVDADADAEAEANKILNQQKADAEAQAKIESDDPVVNIINQNLVALDEKLATGTRSQNISVKELKNNINNAIDKLSISPDEKVDIKERSDNLLNEGLAARNLEISEAGKLKGTKTADAKAQALAKLKRQRAINTDEKRKLRNDIERNSAEVTRNLQGSEAESSAGNLQTILKKFIENEDVTANQLSEVGAKIEDILLTSKGETTDPTITPNNSMENIVARIEELIVNMNDNMSTADITKKNIEEETNLNNEVSGEGKTVDDIVKKTLEDGCK